MGLDYSQKQLINAPFSRHRKRRSGRAGERLQLYAFVTGFMSTLISLAGVIIQAMKN